MPEPSWFARLMERLMVWHDPEQEAEREARYERVRRQAIQVRRRSEVILESYGRESRTVSARRRR